MTDETPTDSLADAVFTTITDWFAASNATPGIVTDFVVVVERVREDGYPGMAVLTPEGQNPARTLGLVGWAEERARDDIRYILNRSYIAPSADEDGD